MKTKVFLLRLSLKNMKIYYFIPPCALFILIPICSWQYIHALGVQQSYISIMDTVQLFIPIISTWWVFCGLKEYIEGDGNELLYVYKTRGKTKVLDILLLILWYCLHVGILFVTYTFFFGLLITEYLCIVIQTFVFSSLLYCLLYILKSTSIAYMFVLIYYFMTAFFSKDTVFEFVSIFSFQTPLTTEILLGKYIYFFLIGVLILLLGVVFNKRFCPK